MDVGDDGLTALVGVLTEAQRLGTLGRQPINEVIDHARAFVSALESVQGSVIDLGTGAGVPGLVILLDRPDLHVTLLDRRTARTDALERALRRLGWIDRASVAPMELREAMRRWPAGFDAAVARGFGAPADTALAGRSLVRPGGLVVISNPPGGHRWSKSWLEEHGLTLRPGDSRVSILSVNA